MQVAQINRRRYKLVRKKEKESIEIQIESNELPIQRERERDRNTEVQFEQYWLEEKVGRQVEAVVMTTTKPKQRDIGVENQAN